MRVAVKKLKDYPLFTRIFFWKQRRKYGKVLEPGLLWARSPLVFGALALLYGALDRKKSPLSPALRSLVTVRVSQINHCEFCTDINSATLIKRGVPLDKISQLSTWQTCPLYSEIEQAALTYTEAITYSDREVDEKIMMRIRNHFDDDAIVELTGLICFQNLSSKFNAALDVAPQGFCRLPNSSTN